MATKKTTKAGKTKAESPTGVGALLEQAEHLRRQADKLEEQAVWQALVEAGGFIRRAAAILGWKNARLHPLISNDTGRLHQLKDKAARLRGEDYEGGRPKSATT